MAVRDEDEEEKEKRKKRAMMREELNSTAGSNRSNLYRVEEMQESERAQQYQEQELTIKVEDMKASLILPSVSSRSGSRNSRNTNSSTVNLDSSTDSLFPLGTVEIHRNTTSEESLSISGAGTTADRKHSANSGSSQILTVLPVSASASEVAAASEGRQQRKLSSHSQASLMTSYHNLGSDLGSEGHVRMMPSVVDNYNEEFPRRTEQLLNHPDGHLWSIEEN